MFTFISERSRLAESLILNPDSPAPLQPEPSSIAAGKKGKKKKVTGARTFGLDKVHALAG